MIDYLSGVSPRMIAWFKCKERADFQLMISLRTDAMHIDHAAQVKDSLIRSVPKWDGLDPWNPSALRRTLVKRMPTNVACAVSLWHGGKLVGEVCYNPREAGNEKRKTA